MDLNNLERVLVPIDFSGCRVRADLPETARKYIERIEELVGCKVGIISVGPDREATADVSNPFGR